MQDSIFVIPIFPIVEPIQTTQTELTGTLKLYPIPFSVTYLSDTEIYFETPKSPGVMNGKRVSFSVSENTFGSAVGGVLPVCTKP